MKKSLKSKLRTVADTTVITLGAACIIIAPIGFAKLTKYAVKEYIELKK